VEPVGQRQRQHAAEQPFGRAADEQDPAVLLEPVSGAGPVRERRPVYVDLLPPCNAGCPAGENIQAWLAHTLAGEHERNRDRNDEAGA